MGFIDKAKDLVNDNAEKIGDAVDKAAEFADEKTGGKYSEKIDKAAEFAKDKTDQAGDKGDSSPGA